jgi:hypothetical protein
MALVTRNDADLSTEEGEELDTQQNELIRVHTAMLNYSLHHLYSYKRWKNVVDVMIKKDPGSSEIHRLWVIHIYEADYNFLLQAKLWQALIKHVESQQLLHSSQYGGLAGREANILVFIEES